MVFRATRFNSAKSGILGSMSGYKSWYLWWITITK
jgi:hypothetical protein